MFISNAYAQGAGAPVGGDTIMSILPMIAIFVVFYFLLIRPQQKKAKETKAMLDALDKGDEVVTVGGVVGKVVKLSESYVVLNIGSEVEMTLQRNAISLLLPKGTIKTI